MLIMKDNEIDFTKHYSILVRHSYSSINLLKKSIKSDDEAIK